MVDVAVHVRVIWLRPFCSHMHLHVPVWLTYSLYQDS